MSLVVLIIEFVFLYIIYNLTSTDINNFVFIIYILIYIFQIIYLFYKAKEGNNYFSFNILFFIMYTLVTYLVPIFYLMGIGNNILSYVYFNESYINKSLFLSSVALSCYTYGYLKGIKKTPENINNKTLNKINELLKISKILTVIATIFFIFQFMLSYKSQRMDVDGFVVTIVSCLIIFSIVVCGYSNIKFELKPLMFLSKHRLILSCSLLITICMLYIGDRMLPLYVICSLAFVFNQFVHKFNVKEFTFIIIFGIIFMFLISYTRHDKDKGIFGGVESFKTEANKAVFFQDLFPINLDFYLGLEWQDKNGYYKPARIIPYLLSPVPFAPSYIRKNFFEGEISTDNLLTRYNLTQINGDSETGIGTHAVLDIYISWGLIGLFIFFIFFGYIVGISRIKVNNIYYLLIYTTLISCSVYIPRESLFVPYRNIIYILIIAYISIGFVKQRQ